MLQEMPQSVPTPSARPSFSITATVSYSLEEAPSPSQERSFSLSKQPPAEPTTEAPAVRTANNAGSPLNGGLLSWLQVLGSFMLFFNTWGLLNTFGVFQTYYESGTLFTESSSNIAWIGGIQAYTLLTVGLISGPIYDRGYLRTLNITGSFGVVFGLMMLSICKTYWQALLAQGFVVGIGAGCLFVPCVAVLPTYFSTKLGLAVGLAAAGSSLGGVIYPIVLYQLIDKLGFGWSVRVLAFIALGTLLIPIAVMKVRVKPPKAKALIDWSAFTDWGWGGIRNRFIQWLHWDRRHLILHLLLRRRPEDHRHQDGLLHRPNLQRRIVFRPSSPQCSCGQDWTVQYHRSGLVHFWRPSSVHGRSQNRSINYRPRNTYWFLQWCVHRVAAYLLRRIDERQDKDRNEAGYGLWHNCVRPVG